MTSLINTLHQLGLDAEESLNGRWVKLRGELGAVYIVEADWGRGYYTWCDTPHARSVERYSDAATAIKAGLRRATNVPPEEELSNTSPRR